MRLWRALSRGLLYAAVLAAAASPAGAQAPLPPQAAEVATCLCLQQAVSALSAEMSAKTEALEAVRQELQQRDADLARARAEVDVSNPQSVARYKQMLERRDAVFGRSTGPVGTDARNAIDRYNARTGEYNARCANRAFDPLLMSQVQASLSCPPLY